MKFKVFARDLIFLGSKKGISKKTQNEYCVISLLTSDNEVIHCFTEEKVDVEKVDVELKKFDRVEVEFFLRVNLGNRLTVIDIRKID